MKEKDLEKAILEIEESNEREIKSDIGLLSNILLETISFIVLFIPRLCLSFLFFILLNPKKAKEYINKSLLFPFKITNEIFEWMFSAKATSFLIFFLFIVFILQVIFINPNTALLERLMTNPNHLLEGNYFSLITSIFLHGNIVHLLSNLFALLIFGRIVEKEFKGNVLWIFLASGVIANFISHIISLMIGDIFYSLGASGGIAGLIIFAILVNPFNLLTTFFGWLVIFSDINGLSNPSQVNHLAHIGGYLALLIIFFFLELKHRKKILFGFIINVIFLIIVYMYYNLGLLGLI